MIKVATLRSDSEVSLFLDFLYLNNIDKISFVPRGSAKYFFTCGFFDIGYHSFASDVYTTQVTCETIRRIYMNESMARYSEGQLEEEMNALRVCYSEQFWLGFHGFEAIVSRYNK